ncbi:MAG: GDP-mannose 4,6-dehydratase, partial [Candidatus Nanoarchaeia archaeon]
GAGFFGSNLVESLIADGHHVTVVDDFSTGSMKNLASVEKSASLDMVEGDILEIPELEYLVSRSDIVFHLAAAVGVELVVHDPVKTISINVHGTERVLKGAARKNTRVIITSTSEVYGKSDKASFSENDDLLIGPPTHSRWSYASSKLLDEFLGMAYFRAMKLPVTIVRLFNTVGPRQTGRYGMVLPRFISRALRNETIEVYGDGEQTRCLCHVQDTVRALRLLECNSQSYGRVFNIGGTEQISINHLAEKVILRLGSKSSIRHVPYEEAYEPGFEDMKHRFPDTRAINQRTGWSPNYSLEQIIDSTANYIKEHSS